MDGLLALLALGLLIAWASGVAIILRTLRRPPRRTYASAVAGARPGEPSELDPPLAFDSWTLASAGESLAVWDVVGGDDAGPMVVMVHGWGDSRIGGLVRLPAIARNASRVLLLDLPGHGESPGRTRLGTSEARHLLDLIGRIAAADSHQPRPIVLYGWSLGAGISIVAAAASAGQDDPNSARIAGVIAEAPYRLPHTPARNVMHVRRLPHRLTLRPAFWLLGTILGVGPAWRGFDRAAHAANLRCPLLVLHGEHDEICPLRDGRDIAAAAPGGRLEVISQGLHNTLWTDEATRPACEAAVAAFLSRVVARGPRAEPAPTIPAPHNAPTQRP